MGEYQGDVTVIADGAEYPATADLRSWGEQEDSPPLPEEAPGLTDWNGKIEILAGEDGAWNVMDAEAHRLRMPDGRTSGFVVSRRYFGTGILLITGSGEPPF
ncbi:hypothetical protein AB0903_31935 [Streptomyces sp. NPDC048389]|uniref:hypothetical protein n=1 Tax=Streptomyces sp. NPDC048389 TaxID=3154622 RepID=UPI003453B190